MDPTAGKHNFHTVDSEIQMELESKMPSHPIVAGLEDMGDHLSSVTIFELLEIDDRPTFVLDLKSPPKKPIFCNQSLRETTNLYPGISKDVDIWLDQATKTPEASEFFNWATSSHQDGIRSRIKCFEMQWAMKTLRNRWRIISGNSDAEAAAKTVPTLQSEFSQLARSQTTDHKRLERPRANHRSTYPSNESLEVQLGLPQDSSAGMGSEERTLSKKNIAQGYQPLGPFDFINPTPLIPLTPHMQFVLDFDWGTIGCGPITSWSSELRHHANVLMSDPRPAGMYFGKERRLIYNEPYIRIAGQKHPRAMGSKFSEVWSEVATAFSDFFDKAEITGESFVVDDALFEVDVNGYIEETYFSISIIPFDGGNGQMAFYNPVIDTTRQVIAERRMNFLVRLGQYIATARQPKDFWRQLLLGFEIEHPDLPFAMLYSAVPENSDSLSEASDQNHLAKTWALEGHIGVPAACTSIPQALGLDPDTENIFPHFSDLVNADSATLLFRNDESLPSFISQARGLNEELPCESAVFLPIRSTAENIFGFLILGLNPQKRYDDDYKVFIELLSRQLSTSMASAVLFEEEVRRGRIAAAQAARDRNLFSEKLAIQAHEALQIETRFRRMADLAPVGMFHVSTSGILIYANNDYYTLTGHPRNVAYPMSWYSVLAEEDYAIMDGEWAKLLRGEAVSFEIRLKRLFFAQELVGGEKVEGRTWIIAAAYPELSADGTVVSILGCLTDISRQKWMEGFQTRRMLEAVELKRQQENFIDMTSHEMRNPLSAIVQCADWASTSIAEFDGASKDVIIPREVVDGWADAAQTVVLCAQHQKRIIDDILTLSKLDSDLLLITPVEVQPVAVIQKGLKMFDSELQGSDMELRFEVGDSFQSLAVDWVKIDPSRMLQVLINLTTNAIKFTQSEPTRKITIRICALTELPTSRPGFEYLPRSKDVKDMTLGSAWGTGPMVYLHIEVHDTGRGLHEHERNLLFKRFSQTSPRTHVQYGGSGLGLFISRELTELQGGQIGVSSKAGEGSTFAFYIKARRCDPPQGPKSPLTHLLNKQGQSKPVNPALAAIPKATNSKNPPDKGILPPATARHVLIVEDNLVNQKVLSKQLRSAGCIVSVANHGGEALAFLETSKFRKGLENDGQELSVVLMDLEMPIMDGLTCVKRIRQLQEEGMLVKHIPVIAVTANARNEQISRAKDCGMDSVVTKPFRIPELLPEIDRQMSIAAERSGEIVRPKMAPL